MAEGGKYLHFGIVNIVTIWIMGLIGLALLGWALKLWKNKGDASAS